MIDATPDSLTACRRHRGQVAVRARLVRSSPTSDAPAAAHRAQ